MTTTTKTTMIILLLLLQMSPEPVMVQMPQPMLPALEMYPYPQTMGQSPQPVKIATKGIVDFGAAATFIQGGTYVVSQTGQGGIAPDADIISGGFKTILGVALDSQRLELQIQASGVTEP